MVSGALAGARILVVEDEFFLADDARSALLKAGAEIVGPAPTVEAATALVEAEDGINGVLLDVNLRGQMAYDVADVLQARGIPFAFVTGYDSGVLPERFSHAPVLKKPTDVDDLIGVLEMLTVGAQAPR